MTMKLLYILSSATKYGGANKSFYYMLKGLMKKGVESLIVLPEYGGLCEYFSSEGIEFRIFRYFFSRYPLFRQDNILKDIILYMPRLVRMVFFNLYGFNSPPLCGVILGVRGICSPTSKYAKIEE
jgi:hypothetical protein